MEFEPPVVALGNKLAVIGHDVACVGYWQPGLARMEHVTPKYRIVRLDRGAHNSITRILRGGIRLLRYYLGVCRFARDFKPQAVIAHNYDVLPVAWWICLPRAQLIYYCMEFAPAPKPRDFQTGWGLLKAVEAPFVRRSNLVVSVEPRRAFLQARQWGRRVDHVVLNTPAFDGVFESTAREAIARRGSRLRCVYAGHVGHRNCFAGLVAAVEEVPEATLDIWGKVSPRLAAQFTAVLTSSKAGASGRLSYRGMTSYKDLKTTLLQYDVGFSFYDDCEVNTALASPAKLGEYLRAGLAIISTSQPTPRRIIEESQCGYVVQPPNLDGLTQLLQHLSANPDAVAEMRKNSLQAFRNRYAYDCQVEPLMKYFAACNSSRF